MSQRANIQGCNSTDGTTFILHPQVVVPLTTGGTFFAAAPTTSTGLTAAGLNGNQSIENIIITSLQGNLPGTASQTYTAISGFASARKLTGQLLGGAGASTTWTFLNQTGGENRWDTINFQNTLNSTNAWTMAFMAGQGTNAVSNSICAFTQYCVRDTGAINISLVNDYFITVALAYQASGGAPKNITVVGGTYSCTQGAGSAACFDDAGNPVTFYVFGNGTVNGASANFAAFRLNNASSVLDISGTQVSSTTSGWNVTGAGIINDRVGNTYSSPLTQFTGKYVPVGGGSSANSASTAATNFGTNLGATNVLSAVSPAGATYDVKIGFRQVTAGTTCGAGSNTVNGVLSWTSGGVTQSTGSGGVPALPTLTISANGSVGSSSAYQSQPIHIDINTQVTFTTTSVLASAGCTVVPQYVVDFSNI